MLKILGRMASWTLLGPGSASGWRCLPCGRNIYSARS